MSATLCDSQDWNLQIGNKVRQHRKTPSEVHALLKLQNPFPSLLVELTAVWAGPAPPCSPPARLFSCRGSCFPAHPPAWSLWHLGLLLQGWCGCRCLVSCAFLGHITTVLTLSASVWGVYAPGDCFGSRRLWLEVLQFMGPTNTKLPQAKERAWLGGGDGQCSCLQKWSAVCRARKRREDSNVCFSSE